MQSAEKYGKYREIELTVRCRAKAGFSSVSLSFLGPDDTAGSDVQSARRRRVELGRRKEREKLAERIRDCTHKRREREGRRPRVTYVGRIRRMMAGERTRGEEGRREDRRLRMKRGGMWWESAFRSVISLITSFTASHRRWMLL